jgi:hypothetical protein
MISALRSQLRVVLRGPDPEARGEHLYVAGALAGVVAVGTVFAQFVVVSPVLWDTFFVFTALALVGLSAANVYWGGGLLAGYVLVFAPTASGLFVAHYDVILGSQTVYIAIRTIAFGLLVVAVVALVFGTVGFLLGETALWARTQAGASP